MKRMISTTFRYNDPRYPFGQGVAAKEMTVHHNGDFSGDMQFVVDNDKITFTGFDSDVPSSVRIPYEVIEQVVLAKLARDKINTLENVDHRDLRKLLFRY